ncbi:MAG TPA: hypothetical protein VFL57_13895, partial [Bryobacteraceae bacterium]|nr:hypothetical protein [Bryobacteraceae bacterium]
MPAPAPQTTSGVPAEVSTPILNSPFDAPREYWYIRDDGTAPERRPGRRPSIVYPPRTQTVTWDLSDRTLQPSRDYPRAFEIVLVNLVRERLAAWREAGRPGASRTTLELLDYWTREGRQKPLFFAQLEAAEIIIFLTEARQDFLQGIDIPLDQPSDNQRAAGARAFLRHACKMA